MASVNTKVSLAMYVGESKTFALTVLDENCDPIDLSGHSLYFTVKASECDEAALIFKSSADPLEIEIDPDQVNNAGKASIKVSAADIAGLESQSYVYDVWLELPSGARRLIAGIATFFIRQPVTLEFV